MSHTYAPRGASSAAKVITNRFAGTCARCGHRVEETKGVAIKAAGASKWTTEHVAGECPAGPAPAAAPRATPATPDLGYYVRADGRAIKVVETKTVNPDGSHRRVGKVLTFHGEGARPSWDYVKGAGYSVADLRPMTAEVAAGLGLSCGYCIFCFNPLGGETLGAAISALIGYGEVCAGHHALFYPKGVKAQRAYLAEHGR